MPKNNYNRKFPTQQDGSVQNANGTPTIDSQYYIVNDPKQNGECVMCQRPAVCVCQRCGDFYCSPECQRNDWQAHRYICFPIPNLVRASLNIPIFPTNVNANVNPNVNANVNNNIAVPSTEKSENVDKQQMKQKNPPNQQTQTQPQNPPQTNNARKSIQQNKVNPPTNQQSCLHPPIIGIPKHNSRVMLTGFRWPNRCYIRCMVDGDDEAFLNAAKTIDAYGKTAPPLTKLPELNSYAITKLDATGTMHRVQILAVKGGFIRVLFLDNGLVSNRQLSDLREISDSIMRIKQYTVQVYLKDVGTYELTPHLRKFLSQFEEKEFQLQVFKDNFGRALNVVMRNCQTNESLNEQIVKFASNPNVDSLNARKSEGSVIGATQRKQNELPTSMDVRSTENNVSGKQEQQRIADASDKNSEIIHTQRKQNELPTSMDVRSAENNVNGKQEQERITDASDKNSEMRAIKDKPQESSSSVVGVMVPPFEMKFFTENAEDIEVIIIDNSCLNLAFFACIARADVQNFVSIQQHLSNFVDTKEAYTPSVNEYCLAKFEGEWYRAKVTAMPNKNEFTVFYVDYTNENVVTSADIRPYPKDLKYPCTTNMCLIEGLPSDISDKLHEYLSSKIPLNSIIKIDRVKNVDDQIVTVELEWLTKKLQDEKLI